MASFEMIKYHHQEYPKGIPLRYEEIAAHFDVTDVRYQLRASLHTEYSYGKRNLDTELIRSFLEIVSAQRKGIPQLWKNENWASQFADFLFSLVEDKSVPDVIEIHPPFSDYTDMDTFIRNYSVFEKKI